MYARTKFVWDTVLMTEDGQTHEGQYAAYWSPHKDFVTPEAVAFAAAAEASVATKKKIVPISATLRAAA